MSLRHQDLKWRPGHQEDSNPMGLLTLLTKPQAALLTHQVLGEAAAGWSVSFHTRKPILVAVRGNRQFSCAILHILLKLSEVVISLDHKRQAIIILVGKDP